MTTSTGQAQHTVQRVLDARRQQPGALLPILHGIQDQPGHVPPEAVPQIADARWGPGQLGLSAGGRRKTRQQQWRKKKESRRTPNSFYIAAPVQ